VLVKKNKILKLGPHRLCCCDCRDKDLVAKLVGKKSIKLILADPPYGVSYVQGKEGFCKIKKRVKVKNDNLVSEKAYRKFSSSWLAAAACHLLPKNSFYIFNSDKMIFALNEAIKEAGFKLSQILIWIKNNQVVGRKDYLLKHELIAYGWYGAHEFIKAKDKSIIFYPKPQSSPNHPTTKPIGLVRRLILNSTRIGDVVYDPFAGSGTTLIAAEQTKRVCITAEISKDYRKTVIDRYRKVKGEI